ncbi:hypothetical protein [Agaribacterium haliotis]|uniref:hypothetical protein n=1 Tax=Agaribacterium haliotis TaxID=2013869 RepID=UPI001177EA37|nr:hypothetical protein [Agaribacterium haliotis]
MSLISRSHVDLVRLRKGMQSCFESGDWMGLRAKDRAMGAALDQAFQDSSRNAVELVAEMERVLALYARIVEALPSSEQEMLQGFPYSRA